jgi:hypothetical protein
MRPVGMAVGAVPRSAAAAKGDHCPEGTTEVGERPVSANMASELWATAGVDLDAVHELVHRSCREQGLPVKVCSPSVIQTVLSLLGCGRQALTSRCQPWGDPALEAPERVGTVGIDFVDAEAAGLDHDVSENRSNHDALAVQSQRRPLAS